MGKLKIVLPLMPLLLPCITAATTAVAVRTANLVIISVDSKPSFPVSDGKVHPSVVSKVHQKGQVVFAICGFDNDPNQGGVHIQEVIANSFEEADPFSLKVSKTEDAVTMAVLQEVHALEQRGDQKQLDFMVNQPFVTGFVFAEYSDGVPHLSARLFRVALQSSSPKITATMDKVACGDEKNPICYAGPNIGGVSKVFASVPDPVRATRTVVENDIRDFEESVGPPVITVVVDRTGVHCYGVPNCQLKDSD